MKKILLLFFIGFTFTQSQSQSLMTVREVYDFNVGDIFIRTGGSWAPPQYYKTIITSKQFSALLDTVYYTYDTYTYIAPPCSACVAYYDTTYGNQGVYTNLDDTLGAGLGTSLHYRNMNCVDTIGYTGVWVDTIYYDPAFCNVQSIKIKTMDNLQLTDSLDTCFSYFEPLWGYDEYGKGVGQKSYYYNTCSQGMSGCESGWWMIFYKKGNDSCGTAPIIPQPTNVDEQKFVASFKIFPNPFSSQTQLSFSQEQKNSEIIITNLLGEEIRRINFSGRELLLEKKDFEKGIYFVRVNDSKNIFSTKLIVQ